MPYTKQTWANGNPATPLNATRLLYLENGIEAAHAAAEADKSLDDTIDSATRVAMTPAERTKLGGVAAGATANSTDAQLRDRSTHTGSQTSGTISDFTEAVQDAVAALLAQGTGVTLSYNDAGNTLTVSATGSGGLDAEAVRDAIGVALIGTGVISVTVNDAADTITISSTATANSTDAQLRDRSTHTGTQAISTVTNLQTSLDAKAPLASPAFTGTPTGITATHVGLGNVNNTSDANKPVSTAQQTALDLKANKTAVEALIVKSGGTWPTRPTGFAAVRWRGADPDPTDMVAGDVREIPIT
jgi:hypothetical protein